VDLSATIAITGWRNHHLRHGCQKRALAIFGVSRRGPSDDFAVYRRRFRRLGQISFKNPGATAFTWILKGAGSIAIDLVSCNAF
jgi:hypothetical protein